jgi:glycogen debranching enzyme
LGLKRYGFSQEVADVALGIFEAGKFFSQYSLPELYAGIEREPGSFRVPSKEANVPQAWAAASVFQLLQTMLGLQANAPNHTLYVDPYLPEWLPQLTLKRVEIGQASIDLRFWRDGDSTRWDASVQAGNV